MIDVDRLCLFDNERATEAMGIRSRWVIPEGARIGSDKAIVKARPRCDRGLCQRRHPVHRVSQADAVPVYGSRLVEFIDDANRKFFPALGPQTGTRGDAVIAGSLHAQDTRVVSRCGGAGSGAKPRRQRAHH